MLDILNFTDFFRPTCGCQCKNSHSHTNFKKSLKLLIYRLSAYFSRVRLDVSSAV